MTRKSIHFTSDWHIGHANSIKFDQRPFKDLDHMHETLIRNYNAQVPVDGICYFLGDIGMTSSDSLAKVMARLNGIKVAVLGNHDKNPNAMYGVGFDVVVYGATLYVANERVTLTHCPLRGVFREDLDHILEYKKKNPLDNWHGEHKNVAYSCSDEGQFHLHGHIHSGPANDKKKIDGRQFDVGAPANNYRPVSLSTIEAWIENTKRLGL